MWGSLFIRSFFLIYIINGQYGKINELEILNNYNIYRESISKIVFFILTTSINFISTYYSSDRNVALNYEFSLQLRVFRTYASSIYVNARWRWQNSFVKNGPSFVSHRTWIIWRLSSQSHPSCAECLSCSCFLPWNRARKLLTWGLFWIILLLSCHPSNNW